LARAPSGTPAADAREADVRVDATFPEGGGRKGHLRVELRDGSSQDREIEADDCAEAVQSMAVIIGMILEAQQPAPPPPPAVEARPDTAPPAEASTPSAPAAPGLARQQATKPMRYPVAPAKWLGAGLGGGLLTGAAPSVMPVAFAFAELGARRQGKLAESLRLELLAGQAADVQTDVGDARFRLGLGRLFTCGVQLGRPNLGLRLCTVVEGGWLVARGMGKALNQRSQWMPWLGAGLAVLGQVGLGRHWALDVQTGARALAIRDVFIFTPSTSVHQVPVFVWDLGIGLSYRER
jgi:hypothetical protein